MGEMAQHYLAISSPSNVYLLSSDSDVKRPRTHELDVSLPTKGLVYLRDVTYSGEKYEAQEVTVHLRNEGEPTEDIYEPKIYDEFLDDFDDSSDSETEGGSKFKSGGFDLNQPVNPSVPSQQRESEGIYGLMMSAGKKVKKTSWSISQRLRRRMSKISIAVTNGNEPAENGEDNQMRWPSFKKKSKSGTSKFYLDAAPSPHEPASLQPSPSDSGLPTPLSLPLVLPAVPASKEPPRRPSPPLSAPDPRRLSTAFATAPRPTSPPPPPPPLVNGEGKGTSKVNDHTLYVESGLFDHTHPPSPQQLAANQTNQSSNETSNGFLSNKNHSNSQWYSDAGLYENTTADPIVGKTRRSIDEPLPDLPIRRVSNSSWYSDLGLNSRKPPSDADSGHGSQLDLQFADEPLYQFYAARVAELEQRENNSDIGYEEIGPNSDLSDREIYSPSDISVGSVGSGGVRPSAMDLVSPESIHRTLWCQVPQVINSGILESLTPNQKRLQEAKFELITSEASYYKSLSVLEKVFANSSAFKDETIIPKVDYKTIFGNIIPVRKCSEAMLAGMEKCWQDSILLDGICDILLSVTKEKFSAYVRYCSHQVAIERTLKRLKKNPIFAEKLSNLESSPACHSLSLSSFLLLPMQRVTRLPLLLDAIMTKLESGSSEFESCQAALLAINKVVYDCNEAARQTERLEEMVALSRALTFPKHLRPLPLMSASRWLVRSGQVVQYNPDTKLTFSKKLTAPRQTKLTLFLFNDLFFVTKKKAEDNFAVITYCLRSFVQMSAEEDPLVAPGSMPSRFLLAITILENHEGKTQELMVYCNSESCRQRWLQPFSRATSEDPDQVLYETWDCPQVVASHTYPSSQPDELSLQPGDVVNVLTKMADGWFYGERLRDSEKGWFPGNYVTEVASAHVRARNLRQRHRLLALSSSLIQQRQQQLG
ncbi:Rho guanine nucleotide exchange factor (GEF) [Nesidiocoris tenuis]|uniref:Rho guanine nucleotide exchange factor (GEF) n=1 Tax=Nesidiocoris tenuis TaxID=355587 RepID=A0ABN7AXH9_9HEMI|nr:Rho guanine nucleotide exchange factor (GEF) [Nesidiocoris tenuis]